MSKLAGLTRRVSAIPTPVVFAASIAMALVLLWSQDALGQVLPTLRDTDPETIVSAFFLYLLGLAVLCFRWHLLIVMVRGSSRLARASEAFLTSVAVNYAAPVSLAIPSRAALTKRALGLSATETGAAAFWEVLTDVVVLAAGSLAWIILGGWRPDASDVSGQQVAIIFATAAILAGLGLAGGIFLSRKRPDLRQKLQGAIGASLAYPVQRPGAALTALAVTIIYWVMQGAVLALILRAVSGEAPDPTLVLGLITAPVLVGMISPVPGGAGVREAMMIGIANIHDADSAAVLLAAVIYRIALFAAIPVLYLLVRLWLALTGEGRGTIEDDVAELAE